MTESDRAEAAACGKVILLGEHAVVYGAPAIVAGIDRGARALATRRAQGPSELTLGGETFAADPEGKDDRAKAFAALLAVEPRLGAVHVEARSDLPAGGGLGSSAALAVAIARAAEALGLRAGESVEEREARVLERAGAWERVFHGNPSGVDAMAAARGGCFRYQRGESVRPIMPRSDLVVCVGSTGKPSSTRETVGLIASLRARRPDVVDRSIDAIAVLVKNAHLAIEAGDLRAVGSFMDLNQMLLTGLWVSTADLDYMCELARGAGALGAKLTGGGGGGSVIALVSPAQDQAEGAQRILEAWKRAGFDGFVARIPAGTPHRSGGSA